MGPNTPSRRIWTSWFWIRRKWSQYDLFCTFVMHTERFWRFLIKPRLYHPFIYRRGFCHSLEGVLFLLPPTTPNQWCVNHFILFLGRVSCDPLEKLTICFSS